MLVGRKPGILGWQIEGFAALLEEAAELERQLRVSLMAQEEGEEGGAGKGQPD